MNSSISTVEGELSTKLKGSFSTPTTTNGRDEGRKKIIQMLKKVAQRHDRFRVFADWVEMMACALSGGSDRFRRHERRNRSLEVVSRYSSEESRLLMQAMNVLTEELAAKRDDLLGKIFSELGLHDVRKGQFFTPYELAKGVRASR